MNMCSIILVSVFCNHVAKQILLDYAALTFNKQMCVNACSHFLMSNLEPKD